MEYSLGYYTSLRETFQQRLSPLSLSGGRRVLLVGSGEVAEIAALVLWEVDLSLEHVVDDEKAASTFLGHKVLGFPEIPELSYDWVILAVLNGSEDILDRLRGLKVPEDRIVLLRDTPARESETDGAG
ncbi:MAG: hypothetical protein ACREJ6_00305 [Candidatus Methylomirabilis sp.]